MGQIRDKCVGDVEALYNLMLGYVKQAGNQEMFPYQKKSSLK